MSGGRDSFIFFVPSRQFAGITVHISPVSTPESVPFTLFVALSARPA